MTALAAVLPAFLFVCGALCGLSALDHDGGPQVAAGVSSHCHAHGDTDSTQPSAPPPPGRPCEHQHAEGAMSLLLAAKNSTIEGPASAQALRRLALDGDPVDAVAHPAAVPERPKLTVSFPLVSLRI